MNRILTEFPMLAQRDDLKDRDHSGNAVLQAKWILHLIILSTFLQVTFLSKRKISSTYTECRKCSEPGMTMGCIYFSAISVTPGSLPLTILSGLENSDTFRERRNSFTEISHQVRIKRERDRILA